MQLFWKIHDPTTLNRQGADVGTQYRSVIFCHDDEQQKAAEHYLQELDSDLSKTNIDYFHLFEAFDCIRTWFEEHGSRRQYVANKFYGYLFESVRVIWYEAPHQLPSATLFTRLNVGRIPLTDAELVKALLLS